MRAAGSAPVSMPPAETGAVRLGLLANWQQFSLLVVVNAFVGGMVGLERAASGAAAPFDNGVTIRSPMSGLVLTIHIGMN